jgi:hypothetical protein
MNPQGRALVVGAAWITPIIPKPARRRRGPPPPPTSPNRRVPPPEPRRRRRLRARGGERGDGRGREADTRSGWLPSWCLVVAVAALARCRCGAGMPWRRRGLFIGSTALRAGASAVRRSGTRGVGRSIRHDHDGTPREIRQTNETEFDSQI